MKANFALSLTEDGIRLFQRVPRGWVIVGEVAHSDTDAASQMATLRREALAREPSGLRTKLLIPNEQIKYLSLANPIATTAEIDAALENATPYTIDALVHDHSRDDSSTYVAAVARETLEEAEAFAEKHGFMPVCFAAVPEDGTYVGEVFFGRTLAALSLLGPGQVIERDDVPVSLDPQPAPAESAASPDAPAKTAAFSEIYDQMVPDAPAAEDSEPSRPRFTPVVTQDAGDQEEETAEERAGPDPTPVLFSHAKPDPAPLKPDANALFSAERPAPKAPDEEAAPSDVASRLSAAAGRLARTIRASGATTEDGDEERTSGIKALFSSSRPATTPETRNEPNLRREPIEPTPAPQTSRTPLAATKEPSEQRRLTVFGARDRQPSTLRDPRYLGLLAGSIVAAFGLGYLGFVGWDRLTSPTAPEISNVEPAIIEIAPSAPPLPFEGTDQPANPDAEQPVTAAADPSLSAPDAQSPSLPDVSESAVASSATVAPVAEVAPESAAATAATTGRVLTPAEAEAIYARTRVWQRAPRMAALPRQMSEESGAPQPLSVPTVSQTPLALPSQNGAAPDPVVLTPPDPPPPGTEFARDARGFILATPEGTVLPNGVVVTAGQPDVPFRARPGTELPPDPPSLQPGAEVAESGALILATAPVVTPPPRPAGIAPEPDIIDPETGRVVAVTAERPAIVPPARPEELAPERPTPVETAPDETATAPEAEPVPEPDATTEAVSTAASPETGPAPIDPETGLPVRIAETLPDTLPPARPDGLAPERVIDPETGLPVPVLQGAPDIQPPTRPEGIAPEEPEALEAPEDGQTTDAAIENDEAIADADLAALIDNPGGIGIGALQPPTRPTGLVATAPSWTRADVGTGSPPARPADLIASALPDSDVDAIAAALTAAAAPASELVPDLTIVPQPRPRNFDRIVSNVREIAASRPVPPAQTAAPSGSVPRSVANAATEENAVSLRGLALLGIFESGGRRTALVRLSNGRISRVGVGDRLDGGQIASIGQTSLTYRAGGRTETLELP